MRKIPLVIKLETLTPIWTGNAFGECEEIKEQSIYGGLRFWFELYCKSLKIPVKDYNSEELKEKVYKENLSSIFKNNKMLNIDEAKKKALDKSHISLVSQIFGCQGLKGNFEIENIESKKEIINKNNIDFKCLGENIEFWMEKTLFNNNSNSIECHSDIVIEVKLSKIYLQEFKQFLKFYEDKVILIGGKNSQGFGFTKLSSNQSLTNIKKVREKNQLYIWDKIELKGKFKNKDVLGFSFKYYCRKEEEGGKQLKKENFGSTGIGSKFYFSNMIREDDKNCLYVIGFPNSTVDKDSDFKSDFKKYCNWSKEVK